MAVTIDATVKGANANAYLTQAEATTFLEDHRIHTEDWTSASDGDKDTTIVWATKVIDQAFEWFGVRTTIEQALRWPRSGIFDLDDFEYDVDALPEILKDATASLAFEFIKADRLKEPGLLGQGFSRAQLGSISVDVDPTALLQEVPEYIVRMLGPLGEVMAQYRTGGKVVQVRRT